MNPLDGVLGEAWAIYKAHARHLLPIALVIYVVIAVVTAILVALLGWVGAVISWAVNLVGVFLLQAALVKAVEDVRDGRADLSLGETLRAAQPRLGSVAGVSILAGLAVAIGLVLCIVPGLWLITFLCVAVPVVVLEGAGPVDGLSRSWRLVSGNGWTVFGVLVLTFLIYLSVEIVIGVFLGAAAPWVRSLVGGVVSGTLVAPFLTTVLTLIYYRLRGLGAAATGGYAA